MKIFCSVQQKTGRFTTEEKGDGRKGNWRNQAAKNLEKEDELIGVAGDSNSESIAI